jgi:hypothetical protein
MYNAKKSQNQRKREENKVQSSNKYHTNFLRHLATHTRHTLPPRVGTELTKWNNEIVIEPPHDPHTRDATSPQRHVTYGYPSAAPTGGWWLLGDYRRRLLSDCMRVTDR